MSISVLLVSTSVLFVCFPFEYPQKMIAYSQALRIKRLYLRFEDYKKHTQDLLKQFKNRGYEMLTSTTKSAELTILTENHFRKA